MSIYVACRRADGSKAWIRDPEVYFDGELYLQFTAGGITVGVNTTLFKSSMGAGGFRRMLEDRLDSVDIPWSRLKNTHFGVKVLSKSEMPELLLANIDLIGPLPAGIADKISGVKVKRPVKLLCRFGG